MVKITEADIKEYGEKAREVSDDVTNNSNVVINTFEDYLTQECGLPWNAEYKDRYGVKRVYVGRNAEEEHYIFVIDSELVEGYEPGGEVWIDLTFDQYNLDNKQDGNVDVSHGLKGELSKIKIMGPDHPAQSGDGLYTLNQTL